MIRFDYFEPSTLDEAIAFLTREGDKARVLAGGTDLLPLLKQRAIRPGYLVNIKRIPHLSGVGYADGGSLSIGALTTIRTLETSPSLKDGWGMVAQAAGHLGSVQVRNIATVGGNLCHGAPSAETAPALIALSAEAVLIGPQGQRRLSLENFFTGPGATVLGAGELLTELLLPLPPSPSGGVYLKLSPRGAMDIAVVGVAAWVALDGRDGSCRDCRLVLGAVAPTPLRAQRAENVLRGEKVTERLIDAAARTAMEESRPISDVRASAEYRREMVGVLTRRALSQALGMARQRTTG